MAKVLVSLPDQLLRDIDAEARRRSMSRSALLAAVARRELTRREPAAVAEAIARSEQRFRAAGRFGAAKLVRRDDRARSELKRVLAERYEAGLALIDDPDLADQ